MMHLRPETVHELNQVCVLDGETAQELMFNQWFQNVLVNSTTLRCHTQNPTINTLGFIPFFVIFFLFCASPILSLIHYLCVCKDSCGVITHSEGESRIVPPAVLFHFWPQHIPDVKYIRPVGSSFLPSSPPTHLPGSLSLPSSPLLLLLIPLHSSNALSSLLLINIFAFMHFRVIMREKLVELPQQDFSTKSPNQCRNHSLHYNWLE